MYFDIAVNIENNKLDCDLIETKDARYFLNKAIETDKRNPRNEVYLTHISLLKK